MIKKYNQFVNESKQVPGPGTEGSNKITLSNEESILFNSEPALEELISNNKIALLTPDLWYMEDDEETIGILKSYIDTSFNENPPKDSPWVAENESKLNEDLDTKGKKDLEKLEKRIKDLQAEYDKKAKELGVEKEESYKDKMKRKVVEAKERKK